MNRFLIHRTNLQGYRPIILYGQAIYLYYSRLFQVLSEHLGQEHADLLSEPMISREAVEGKDDALWFSNSLSDAVPYHSLSLQDKPQVEEKLKRLIDDVESLAHRLQQKEDDNLRISGELLNHAIQIPSMNHVYTVGDKVCLACWGFTSDEAIKTDFRLSKVLRKDSPLDEDEKNPKPIETATKGGSQPPPGPSNPPKSNEFKRNFIPKAFLRYFFIGLFFFFLIFLLIWFPLPEKNHLPEKPGLASVDPTKIIQDGSDPLGRRAVSNRLIILLDIDVDLEEYAANFSNKYSDDGFQFVGFEPALNLLQAEIPKDEMVLWEKRFREFDGTKGVTLDSINRGGYVPTDEVFQENEEDKLWPLVQIGAFSAWEITRGNSNITIAVIDSGFDLSHPELADKIVSPWNAFDKTSQLLNSEPVAVHGTHVAAIAGANADNRFGICGVCPDCSIMPIQVGNQAGDIPDSAIISGILHAMKMGAQVINLSLGAMFQLDLSKLNNEEKRLQTDLYIKMTREKEQLWERLFETAAKRNVIIVQAAGNDNIYSDIDPMKRNPFSINVAASDSSKKRAPFSNFGRKTLLSAPGEKIYNALPNNNFGFLSGTSMASPMVAGAVGLLKTINQDFTLENVSSILSTTGEKLSPENATKYIGPLIRIDLALEKASAPGSNLDRGDCEDIIGNLKDEIERLKKEIEKLKRTNPSRLKIPEVPPNDFSFAEGRWKSSNNLINKQDNKKVLIYFDISKSGDGRITLVEENGTQCISEIKLSFNLKKLVIDQLDKAVCEGEATAYMPYFFECEADDDRTARCKGNPKNDPEQLVHFFLYKE